MKFRGSGIGHGTAEGEILVSGTPISFLGGVDPDTGRIRDRDSDAMRECVSGRIFAFPHGKGSTVGSYVIYQMMKNGTAPAGIVNQQAETVVATGAIIAGIPMLNLVPVDILRNGDQASIDADLGLIELPEVEGREVVTVIAKHGQEILLLKRSPKVGSFANLWAGVSGAINEGEDPERAALRELKEETDIEPRDVDIIARGERIHVRDGRILWTIQPFLAEVRKREVSLDWEHSEYRWIPPERLGEFQTVPKLDTAVRKLFRTLGSAESGGCSG